MRQSTPVLRGFLRALCLASCISPDATADTPREIAERVMPSVVLLHMKDSNGQPLTMGSGFVVSEGVIATNMHVIESAASGYALLVGEEKKQPSSTTQPEWRKMVTPLYDIRGVVASDATRDLVLLAVEGIKASPLAIGDSDQVAVGDEVYAVGNPRGLEGTFSAGIVSGVRTVGEDSLLQITAPISPGSSGGPVVNIKGEVIGIAVATFKGGQNLNFAIPSRYLSALIVQEASPKPLSEVTAASAETSVTNRIGDHLADGVTGADFMWDSPRFTVLDKEVRYSLTLRNNLRHDVRNVRFLVVFYNQNGEIIDAREGEYRYDQYVQRVIRAGLAARVEGSVHRSVEELTTPIGSNLPNTKIEVRILDFELVESEAMGKRR